MLKSILGDLIYIDKSDLDALGSGQVDEKKLQELEEKVFNASYMADSTKKPIRIRGKVSYVEQYAWI